MFLIQRYLLIFNFLMAGLCGVAQTSADYKTCKPPINRQLYHDYIDREQKAILRLDGKPDNFLYASQDEDINFLVSQSLSQRVDQLQCKLEQDTATNHQKKVTYLRGLEKMLKAFTAEFRKRSFHASSWPAVLDSYEAAVNEDKMGRSIEQVVDKRNYEISNMLIGSGAFDGNPGFKSARYAVIRKFAHQAPSQIFYMLKQNPDLPFRDSLILVAAYHDPSQLYDYAAADNKLGYAIRNVNDPLIKAVSKMAKSGGSGQMYFPFLDAILRGTQTMEEIDAVKNDDVRYFRLLVKTRQDYIKRTREKQPVYEMEGLTKRLEDKAKNVFIKQINGLHESPDAVRFRILHSLTPQELYYVAVFSESEIYTSSYTRGVYPIMMQKIGNRGDSLLYSVGFDRFKKFIKLAAGFNTLNDFLATFPKKEDSRTLMTAFVNGLEKAEGLEDGVDVADSYVSISEGDKDLAKFILNLTRENLEKNLSVNNQRGVVMYNLLHKLFLSADSTNNIDLSREFGIPPVYQVNYGALAVDSQRVVTQVFFYGDEDGRRNYSLFVPQFSGSSWKKIEDNKNWIAFASTRGKPIVIYANKPLDEEKDEDEAAQEALIAYLGEKGLEPTIVVHRGHSYYAPYTIKHIRPSAKIVFLGSCGGYHLIHDVLTHAPDAHIISSKQIGKEVINRPFIDLLNEKLLGGNNIDWIPFWAEFKRRAGKTEGFDDYIPPHKNLGAIFIKAYTNQMGEPAGAE